MAAGEGPSQAVMALGYAGWDAGQLEQELMANAG
jgi:putative transcriptional regulator